MLSRKEKSEIIKIIQREKFSNKDKELLISLLIKLKYEDLVVLIGKKFEIYAKKYVHLGNEWLNKTVLLDFLIKDNENLEDSEDRSFNEKGIVKKSSKNDRIIINPNILKKVCNEIMSKSPQISSYTKIGNLIGISSNINKVLRGNLTLSLSSFKKLEKLYGNKIPYKIKLGFFEQIILEKNNDTAGFVGLILGDGHLVFKKYDYRLNIALNGVDEYPIVESVKKLFKTIFQMELTESWARDMDNASGDEKAVFLDIRYAAVVKAVLDLGLVAGNKVKNQVRVPPWIFKEDSFKINCLKWLTDTDGCIYVDKYNRAIRIVFVNGSKFLVEDYKKLCYSLGIRTGNVNGPYNIMDPRTGKKIITYSVKVNAKDQVKKFIRIVNPQKWKINYENIGKKLKSLGSGQSINEAINNALTSKRIHYSRQYAEYLRNLYIEFGGFHNIERYFIQEKIESSLSRRTMPSFMKKYFREKDIFEKYGENAYDLWKFYNSNIIIEGSLGKIKRFPLHLRKFFCRYVYSLLEKYKGIIITNSFILNNIKSVVDNEELNGERRSNKIENPIEKINYETMELKNFQNIEEIIDDLILENNISILKYERLSFLWNNPLYRHTLIKFFRKHIRFVKELFKLQNKRINLSQFHIKFPFLGETENIKNIILDINKFFNEKFILP